jgi:zinc transport system permease protein
MLDLSELYYLGINEITMIVPEFLLLAILGGLVTTLATAPIGTIMLWRKMAYFGDALAHTSLLGFGLSIWLTIPSTFALIALAVTLAIAMILLHRYRQVSFDTLLAIAAHSSLGIGMMVIALLPSARVDLMSYLFGDLLSLTWQDLSLLTTVMLLSNGIIIYYWRGFVLASLNEDLAKIEGQNTELLSLLLALLIAIVVAVSIQLVGALLMTALLITPAAIAMRWSKTPSQMILLAIMIGIIAVLAGLLIAWQLDTPIAPAIVSLLFTGFVLSRLRLA